MGGLLAAEAPVGCASMRPHCLWKRLSRHAWLFPSPALGRHLEPLVSQAHVHGSVQRAWSLGSSLPPVSRPHRPLCFGVGVSHS